MKALVERFLNRETINYILTGVFSTIIGFGTYCLLIFSGFNVVTANTVSTGLAVLFAYVTNKIYVFQSTSWSIKIVATEFISFCGGRFVTYVMETGLLVLLVDKLRLPSLICKCFTAVLVVTGNYIISKWAVFGRSKK